MEIQKHKTKLTLDEIRGANDLFRLTLISNSEKSLTNLDIYKKTVENGIPGFSTQELKEIEEKYKNQGGVYQADIQNELKKKGWLVKPNTLKHYIQKGQLPRAMKRMKTQKGAVSLYPINFMRHLNFVRFMLNAGKEKYQEIFNSFRNSHPCKICDHDLAKQQESEYPDDVILPIYGRLGMLLDWDVGCVLTTIESALAVIDGSTEDTDEGKLQRKNFENLIKQAQIISEDSNNQNTGNFKKELKSRFESYKLEVLKIKVSIELNYFEAKQLEEKMKSTFWTI